MSAYLDNPLKDRVKAFLLNEDMADVHFLVGIDNVKERLPEHKFVLSTASEVFHGQLHGHFEVPDTIVVEDTTPAVFKLVLSYIYTDEIELTPDNAFPVLDMARKYLLNKLVAKASAYFTTAYNGKSVAKILPHLHLVGDEHAERVWEAIDRNASVVLKSLEFVELSHDVLCDILCRDLDVDELSVYNSAVAWTRAECQRQERPFATDAREVLDDALKLIRFPVMSIDEFASDSGPADSNILSDKEKLELYKWYGVRTGNALTTFSSTPRKRPMLSCVRFDLSSAMRQDWPNTEDYKQWFFNFSVSTRVRFHGVAFLGRKNESVVYNVNVSLLNDGSGEVLATTQTTVTTDPDEDVYKVLFDRPVMIAAGIQYKISAVSFGPPSMYAENGRCEVTCEHGSRSVTFAFTDTKRRSKDKYDVSVRGHIPVIYFSFA